MVCIRGEDNFSCIFSVSNLVVQTYRTLDSKGKVGKLVNIDLKRFSIQLLIINAYNIFPSNCHASYNFVNHKTNGQS